MLTKEHNASSQTFQAILPPFEKELEQEFVKRRVLKPVTLQLQIQALMLYSLSTACFYIETHISALKHLLHSLLPVQIPLDTEMRLQTALFLR